jgi:hypothetical protein
MLDKEPMAIRNRTRALLAGVLAAVAVAGATVAAYSDPVPDLPPIGADELVASVIDRAGAPGPISGLLTTHVDIGLPSLPSGAPPPEDPTMRAIDALNGDRRLRLWASKDGVRLALLLPTSELGWFLSRSGGRAEAWAWDSQTFTAVHAGPVADHHAEASGSRGSLAHLVDPLELARRSLEAIAPTTRVEVGESLRIAGRDAYRLVLEPRTAATLVGRIEIGVDAERRTPLGVAVFARGAESPALSVAFSSVSFGPIAPSTYRFSPPEGATVREIGDLSGWPVDLPPPRPGPPDGSPDSDAEPIRVFGRGWASVVAIPTTPTEIGGLEGLLPFSGSLFSFRLVDRMGGGWLLVGAVPQTRLASLARTLP